MNVSLLSTASTPPVVRDWRTALPVLTGTAVTLRELELSDAPSLLAMLTTAEVARFVSPRPTSVAAFERFIMWAQHERRRGTYMCFAVVPHGMASAVGLFQVRQLEADFATAEWGFAIGSAFWGSGAFTDGAGLALEFAFGTLGVRRLEARSAVGNGRGNGALRKLGAVREAVLRHAFVFEGEYTDQVLWSIVDSDWRHMKASVGGGVAIH